MSTSTLEVGKAFPVSPSSRRAGCSKLSVFWLAEDEVSYYGLPPLLAMVPHVGRAVVGRSAAEVRSLLGREPFDVAVIPLAELPEVLDDGPWRGLPRVLAIVRDRVAARSATRYQVAGCLVWDDIHVAGLSGTFERLMRGDAPASLAAVRGDAPAALATVRGPDAQMAGRLTERERLVLALLLQGMSNHQIGRSMGISIHGVKRHVSNLLVKFNCSNRTEVALVAQRLGLDTARNSRARCRAV
jgi:DNA-binding CsgD family transcriptional regulator